MASRQFEVITRCTIFSQIANFCRKVLGKEDGEQSAESPIPARVAGQRRTLSRDQHPISRKEISENALKVLYRLNKGGYEAYLVGGGVRDLLLGKTPKDFDIATDATPEQIKSLFSNCRLIGRRFRLAHIVFGRDVIEVATFRGHHHQVNTSKHVSAQSDEGMLLRDNVYGTIEEDAERRDFTVNALYYSAKDFTLHDFEGGLEDLAERKLELIGDPETRYREDPVRMLRAVRFAAKLDMTISPRTAAPIKELAGAAAAGYSGGPPVRGNPQAVPGWRWPGHLQAAARIRPVPAAVPASSCAVYPARQLALRAVHRAGADRYRHPGTGRQARHPRLPLRHPVVGLCRGPRPGAGERERPALV